MMVVRLEDNYRLLDRLQIPVVLHGMQDKNTASFSRDPKQQSGSGCTGWTKEDLNKAIAIRCEKKYS